MALEKSILKTEKTITGPIQSKIVEGNLFGAIHQVETLVNIIPVESDITGLGLTAENIIRLINVQDADREGFSVKHKVGDILSERDFDNIHDGMPSTLGEPNNNKGSIVLGAQTVDNTFLEQNPNRMGQVMAFHTLLQDETGKESWLVTRLNWKVSGSGGNKEFEYIGDDHLLVVDAPNQPFVVDLDQIINNQ